MKHLTAPLLATLLAASTALPLTAAEPESGFGLTPSKPDTILPSGAGELPLIPDAMPPLDRSPLDKATIDRVKREKTSITDAAEDALRQRIKLRQVKTKAQRDPGLQALWAEGLAARTDYDQRKAWTSYYTQLYALMGKIDRSFKKTELDAMRNSDLNRFRQDRIAPTEPPQVARAERR